MRRSIISEKPRMCVSGVRNSCETSAMRWLIACSRLSRRWAKPSSHTTSKSDQTAIATVNRPSPAYISGNTPDATKARTAPIPASRVQRPSVRASSTGMTRATASGEPQPPVPATNPATATNQAKMRPNAPQRRPLHGNKMNPVSAGANANAAAAATTWRSPPPKTPAIAAATTPAAQIQPAKASVAAIGAAFAPGVTACCVDTETWLASKRLLNALGERVPAMSRSRKRTHQSRIKEQKPMRSLAVWTTTAAVALLGVANAQTPASTEAGASNVDLQTAVTAYAAYQSDVSELRASTMRDAAGLESALDRVARHNRDALTRGWISYGANTAAQSPAFVQGVRDAAAYYGRDAVIWAVTVDPSYA